jgi:3-mercaptopyruvate sulfurtransferase SseA
MGRKKAAFISDLKRLGVLLGLSMFLAVVINFVRRAPLGLGYSTPMEEIHDRALGRGMPPPGNPPGGSPVQQSSIVIVEIGDVKAVLGKGSHLIVDARPDLFWEIGHIPGAINLPKKQFTEFYPKVERQLQAATLKRQSLIIYCADVHCPDAVALAKELQSRGFPRIQVFEAGWAAWKEAGMPVESR